MKGIVFVFVFTPSQTVRLYHVEYERKSKVNLFDGALFNTVRHVVFFCFFVFFVTYG